MRAVPAGKPPRAPNRRAVAARADLERISSARGAKNADKNGEREKAGGGVPAGPVAARGAPVSISGQSSVPGQLKRVRSLWKPRPLLADEKLLIFLAGVNEEALLAHDGGEFHRWICECEAGRASAADGAPYPLVVQDADLRTVLEIQPGQGGWERAAGVQWRRGEKEREDAEPAQARRSVLDKKARAAKDQARGAAQPRPSPTQAPLLGIKTPRVSAVPLEAQADALALNRGPRASTSGGGVLAAALAAAGSARPWLAARLAADPPYVRHVGPSPDELELRVEYDLDDEDEAWLAAYNARGGRKKEEGKKKGGGGRSRKRARAEDLPEISPSEFEPLSPEGMERLMDRMEKEYTAALQRSPQVWVECGLGNEAPRPDKVDSTTGSTSDDASGPLPLASEPLSLAPPSHPPPAPATWVNPSSPRQALASIRAIFPLERCLSSPNLGCPPAAAAAVHAHWAAKHARAARPLIQRLWYEPPWHRRAAREPAADEPFAARDAAGHQRRRARRLRPDQVRARLEEVRRDLESVRTLADRLRRRERLKLQDAALFAAAHAARTARALAERGEACKDGGEGGGPARSGGRGRGTQPGPGGLSSAAAVKERVRAQVGAPRSANPRTLADAPRTDASVGWAPLRPLYAVQVLGSLGATSEAAPPAPPEAAARAARAAARRGLRDGGWEGTASPAPAARGAGPRTTLGSSEEEPSTTTAVALSSRGSDDASSRVREKKARAQGEEAPGKKRPTR